MCTSCRLALPLAEAAGVHVTLTGGRLSHTAPPPHTCTTTPPCFLQEGDDIGGADMGGRANFEHEPPNSDVSTNALSAWLTSTERSHLHSDSQTVNMLVARMRALQGAAVLASRQAMRARPSAHQTEHAAAGRARSKAAAAEKCGGGCSSRAVGGGGGRAQKEKRRKVARGKKVASVAGKLHYGMDGW
jgi:hypothetical protein